MRLLLLVLLTAASALCSLSIHTSTYDSYANMTLTLDRAEGGLSGFTISVAVEGGEIIRVYFPRWAELSEWRDGVLKAVDLRDAVRPGAVGVKLATLALKIKNTSAIVEIYARIDDDYGNPRFERAAVVVERPVEAVAVTETAVQRQEATAHEPLLWALLGGALVAIGVAVGVLVTRRRG